MIKRTAAVLLLALLLTGCGQRSVTSRQQSVAASTTWCPSHVLRFAKVWPREAREIRQYAKRNGYNVNSLIRINRRQLLRYADIRRFNASRLVGWDADKARNFVEHHGCEWRVVTRNGVDLAVTMDMNTGRVDVAVSHGIVRHVAVY